MRSATVLDKIRIMGYSPFYQAMPEDSGLFRLLKDDRRAEVLLAYLFPQGSRPLNLWEHQEATDQEALDHLVKWSSFFDSRLDAELTLKTLSEEIDRACLAHPGLMDRVAFVEKTSDLIEERLKERLDPDILARVARREGWVFGSDSCFSIWEPGLGSNRFGVVSSSRVELVSSILDDVEAQSLFNEDEDHLLEDFQGLKDLYQEAASLGEAIIVN